MRSHCRIFNWHATRSLLCFRKVTFVGDELAMNLEGDYFSDPGKRRSGPGLNFDETYQLCVIWLPLGPVFYTVSVSNQGLLHGKVTFF